MSEVANLPAIYQPKELVADILTIGQTVDVGEFFWIPKEDVIGFDRDWQHGHNVKDGGSVSIGCSVEIRGFEDDTAIVRLNRPEMPYGAPAPIGIVFSLPIEQVQSWSEKLTEKRAREKARSAKARIYCQ